MLTETVIPGFEVYIRLVWLFVVINIFLMLILGCLYLAIRRAWERESQSRAFSLLAIERLETEQRRVSRELHDTVLPLVRDTAVSDLIRSICMELMPPDFTRLSLKDSLAWLCAQFTKRSGIECACSIEEALDFSRVRPEDQLHLYRMAQEALTNIEKHSQSKKAAFVAYRYTRDGAETILISISDDGVGLRPGGSVKGLGMKSMCQRAAIIGARLDFISDSGNGLRVRIEVPAPQETRPPAGGTAQ
jgi:two-component system NarL family sensor kinase